MIESHRMVREVSAEIEKAVKNANEAYAEGDALEEDHITGHLLGGISNNLDDKYIKNFRWRGKQFTGRGGGSEESKIGSDFMGVIDIDLNGYSVKKGFLIQAKKAEPGVSMPTKQWGDFTDQVEKMLKVSPSSYVLVYSSELGMRIFPAISVLNLDSRNIFDLYSRSVRRFFEDHLQCFIGDQMLNTSIVDKLIKEARKSKNGITLQSLSHAKRLLYLGVSK